MNAPPNLKDFLVAQEKKSLLRFLTCGSVDDGKSTLIGRLLYDTKLLFEDTLASLEKDSRKFGTTGEDIDFALLVDGLEAEREQGITIDVAYRFFATDKRKFIVADTPGHEQYTRNMATGASNSDLAVILIDARKGVLTQTRRHAYIASLLGIRHIVLAVNKIDLVGYDQKVFDAIVADFHLFAARLNFQSQVAIPDLGALRRQCDREIGPDALVQRPGAAGAPGNGGRGHRPGRHAVPPAGAVGQTAPISTSVASPAPLLVPRQTRRHGCRRQVGAGPAPSTRIVTMDGDLPEAVAGDAITLTLADEVDISRGDVLAAPDNRPAVSGQFAAHLLWMADEELLPGRQYLLKLGTATVPAAVSELKHKVDVNTLDHLAGKTLALNEVGYANFSLAQPLAFDPYRAKDGSISRDTGGFILIDRFHQRHRRRRHDRFLADARHQCALAGAGCEQAGACRDEGPAAGGCCGSPACRVPGKSTIANLVEKHLAAEGKHTYLLDGDNVRHGLNRDLGFTDADRVENIRRVGETARLFIDAGLIVLTAFISPFRSERRMARELLGDGEFLEVFVDTPIEVCMRRDPKGLYEKAKAGTIKNFTGIDSPYERPEHAELTVSTVETSPEAHAQAIVGLPTRAGLSGLSLRITEC